MNDLLSRLEKIQDQCMDPAKRKAKQEAEKNMDDFVRLKKRIAEELKDVRKRIDERNELLGTKGNANNPQSVRISSDIRAKLKDIQKQAEELSNIHKKEQESLEKKKKKAKPDADFSTVEKEIQMRGEIVELCYKHIEECKFLERQGNTNTATELPIDHGTKSVAAPSSLPDIDDDRFIMLKKEDQRLDEKLDQIAEGVQVLKGIAKDMGKEIELQSVMIDDLEQHVDKTTANLKNLNKRLKDQLDNVRSCDRFVLDFICIILILGVVGLIYNMLS